MMCLQTDHTLHLNFLKRVHLALNLPPETSPIVFLCTYKEANAMDRIYFCPRGLPIKGKPAGLDETDGTEVIQDSCHNTRGKQG